MRASRERGEHGTENASSCSGPNGEAHAHFCDCDECLNAAPLKLSDEPQVRTIETPFVETKWVAKVA